MNASELRVRLNPQVIGREIFVHEEIPSTNDVVMTLGKSGAPEGLVVFAETQTAGRGRLGRRWQSRPGLGLWFSILLRPNWPDYSRLSLAVAVGVARGLSVFLREPAGIKWPNDIWLGGKKTAGILCESSGDIVVVGIGLNVLHQAEDFPPELQGKATSLAIHTGVSHDLNTVAAAILSSLDKLYARLPEAFPDVLDECARHSVLQGKKVRIEAGVELSEGVVTGLDVGGGLLVQTDAGQRIITAGEVTSLEY